MRFGAFRERKTAVLTDYVSPLPELENVEITKE
jgi:hypothetical protein